MPQLEAGSIASALLLASTALVGCSSLGNCPPEGEELTVTTGKTFAEFRLYESAPSYGPLDPFPAQTTVHFIHELGFRPEHRESFVSFTATGSDSADSPGNQSRWLCVDDHEVVIRNDTCENFFISVTVSGTGEQHAPCTCAEGLGKDECP